MDAFVTGSKRPLSEVDENVPKTAPKKTKAPPPAAPAIDFDAAEIKSFMAALTKQVVAAIKKTGHNRKKKPTTEVTVGVASKEFAEALFGGVGQIAPGKSLKVSLGPSDVTAWLGIKDQGRVHPVKFDGKVLCMPGQNPQIYCWASFLGMEGSLKGNSLKLKFKTHLTHFGKPGHEEAAEESGR
mmetsp:Transcript_16113/g.35709  ORF Transcript_16113/g.35709 Transcript_16113/m.35709 type:complete len:184 (-) Transcript_16113:320-871(-)